MGALRKVKPSTAISGEAGAFLGVASSARGFAWRERLAPQSANLALAISQQHGLPELLGRMLAARGASVESVPVFLDPALKALMPDPSLLKDMDKAAARLADAILRREPTAIFGDYDVDGACSSALLTRFLGEHGVPARIYIPDRMFEGYGPNAAALEMLVKEGAKLIVTVDCGTTSLEALAAVRKLATDVVVIDHHQAGEVLPEVHALVNPNRHDDISGQGHLCAAGVVFLVMVATARELRRRGHYAKGQPEPALLNSLDLVALATVADVVPLTGLNRAYVTKGLAVMRARENTGLRALADAAGLNQPPTAYHLGYILGPRINAGGRIGDAALGAKLLVTEDGTEAQRIAGLLERLNKERKAIEQTMLEEAVANAENMIGADPSMPLVMLASDTWHKGVVGLVASRLVERLGRPACVVAWDKDAGGRILAGTGSLRSIAGIDIGSAVRAAVDAGVLVKGGGHAMAAGLTVTPERFEDVRTFLIGRVAAKRGDAAPASALEFDGALTASGVTVELINLIERAGPYGQGNPQPRFAFPAHRVKFAKVVGEKHVRCVLEAGDGARLEGVAFRAAGEALGETLMGAGGMPLHIAGNLRRDSWGGREKIELTIEDAADPRRQP